MFRLLGGQIPIALDNMIRIPRIGQFKSIEELGLRNGISGRDWLMSRASIMITPQLWRRQILDLSDELLYIIERLPQYLLGVLQNVWNNYEETGSWDCLIQSTKVPILNDTSRDLQATILLPSLTKFAAELDLSHEMPRTGSRATQLLVSSTITKGSTGFLCTVYSSAILTYWTV